MKYVIKSYDRPGFMIAGIGIGECCTTDNVIWTDTEADALLLEEEEAAAVITFISDVIDWELAEGLYAEQMEE